MIRQQPVAVRGRFALRASLCAAVLFAPVDGAHAQSDWVAERGTLPRGTTYELRKPNNWNGTLISNLGFAASPDNATNVWLLQHGYALSGTARRADRNANYDPAHEIIDLINVMDLFTAKFGKPRRTIQYGGSGGGFVTLAMAEMHPDRIDGAVAVCAHVPVWARNSVFDAFFVLQTLIAPELPAANGASDAPARWTAALAAAQQTAIGRARIALAFTIGQRPPWVNATYPEPDPGDGPAFQKGMFEAMLELASRARAPGMFDVAGGGPIA